jgi:hypothetical protein
LAENQAKKPAGKGVRPVHRIVGTIILLFTLYFGATGSVIQMIDIRAVLSHAAATDPEMMAIRESIDGTPNYSVIQATDYAAPALPDGFDFNAALGNVLKGARESAGADATLRYVELRMTDGKPIGLVQAAADKGNRVIRVDPATGAVLPNPPPRPRQRPAQSEHNIVKRWHRLQQIGLPDQWELVNGIVGLCLFVMVITGLALYFQLLRTRRRAGLNAIFWIAGGWWRSIHRWVAIVAAVFLIVVSLSGASLAFDSVVLGFAQAKIRATGVKGPAFPPGMLGDQSSPLQDAELPGMLQTTLTAYHAADGNAPIKVLRLRYYVGTPQGLLIYGSGGATSDDTHQVVFNAQTGQRTSTTEPSYPFTGFPFGWKEHELMKEIHRGDIIGVPGRFMDLFAGLSLVYLSLSGLVMYVDLWLRRRRGGRIAPFWT